LEKEGSGRPYDQKEVGNAYKSLTDEQFKELVLERQFGAYPSAWYNSIIKEKIEEVKDLVSYACLSLTFYCSWYISASTLRLSSV
jgi:hypothetical protein